MTMLCRRILILCLCLLLPASGALAQDETAEGSSTAQAIETAFTSWDETASHAEQLLNNGNAPEDTLTALRQKLSGQRSEQLAVQTRVKERLATLKAQLEALGPTPTEGQTEAETISARRAELAAEIAEVEAPVLKAELAYRRSEGLIGEIDTTLRARYSAQITERTKSPLNPESWQAAFVGLRAIGNDILRTSAQSWQANYRRKMLMDALPMLVFALVAGGVLLFLVQPRLTGWLEQRQEATDRPGGRTGIAFALNIVRTVVPLAVALMVIEALAGFIPSGRVLNIIVDSLPDLALAIIAASWLARTLYAPGRPRLAVLSLPPAWARAASNWTLALGLVLGLYQMTHAVVTSGIVPTEGQAVLLAPFLVIGALLLYRMGRALTRQARPGSPADEDEDAQNAVSAVPTLARLVMGIALAIPLAVFAGYLNLADYLFVPGLASLGLIGALVVIHTVARDGLDLWLNAATNPHQASQRERFRLLPVLIGTLLVSLGIPLLALIWGARNSDIEEVWIWLQTGVPIGDSRLSVTDFARFVLIFVVGYMLTRMLQTVLRSSVLPRTSIDVGGRNAIVTGLGYVGIILAAVFAISSTGLNLSNLAIVAGALSVGIGFGLQTIVSNFVSGIILLIERPIKEGDWIEVAGFAGNVKKISVRSTEITTFDRSSVIVPNAELIAGSVLNWTHHNTLGRIIVKIGVAYGSDARKVEALLQEIAGAHPLVLKAPAPFIVFADFGTDALNFEIRAYLRDINNMLSVTSALRFEIYARFQEEGIEIPFAQQDLHIRNLDELASILKPETLRR